MGELPFVGRERRELVARLLEVFDDVVSSGSPRLVTLEAGSGWGKSRLVRELYGRLAAERQATGFWPESILGAVPERDVRLMDSPDGRRKRVFPASFEPPSGAVPEWLWWGISATARQGGSPVNALAADREQVDRFREHLAARLAELNPSKPWAKAVRAVRSDGSKDVGWEVIEQSIESAASVAGVAGLVVGAPLGFLLLGGRYAWKHRAGLSRLAGRFEPEAFEQRDVRGEMVIETARALGDFAAGGIPVVMVLEDAHQADETLTDLLVQVLQDGRGPVMILATAWPGTLEDQERQAHRLLTDVPVSSMMRFCPPDLAELGIDDRRALAEALLPHATPTQRQMLAERWSSPLMLEVGCRLPAVSQMLEDGELTPANLDALPVDVEGLYRAMWDDLPHEVRQALILAVLATPSTASSRLFTDRHWDVALPAAAAAGLDWLRDEAQSLKTRLIQDAPAYDWVRRVDEWLQTFHDPAQHQVAEAAALDPTTYSLSRRRAYYQALADAIVLEGREEITEDRRAAQTRLLVSLAFEGFIDWSEEVIAAADLLIDELAQESDTQSRRILIELADAVPVSGQNPGYARHRHAAVALALLGQFEAAVDRLETLLDDAPGIRDENYSEWVRVRVHLVSWLGETGRSSEAVDLAQELIDDTLKLHGEDDRKVLAVRAALNLTLRGSFSAEELVDRQYKVLSDAMRLFGEDDKQTLDNRLYLADFLADAERWDEALDESYATLNSAVRQFGKDDAFSVEARSSLAQLLRRTVESGREERTDEAIEQQSLVMADHVRLFGEDHPSTTNERESLTRLLTHVGRTDEAIQQQSLVVAGHIRLFGEDHPDTLRERRILGRTYHAAGRWDEAMEELALVLDRQVQLFGDDDPDTQNTHLALNVLHLQAGLRIEASARLLLSVADSDLDAAIEQAEGHVRELERLGQFERRVDADRKITKQVVEILRELKRRAGRADT